MMVMMNDGVRVMVVHFIGRDIQKKKVTERKGFVVICVRRMRVENKISDGVE